jgi:hypothetical protein
MTIMVLQSNDYGVREAPGTAGVCVCVCVCVIVCVSVCVCVRVV